MLVPHLLFGTAREVSGSVGKVVTQLKRGATLEDLCESSSQVDLADFPRSLVWIDRAWALRSSAERDCRAVLLTHGIFDGKRIPFERSNSIREESVEYLSRSPWGTALLNAGRGGEWHTARPLGPLRPSRRGFVATLAGTLRHWEALEALGPRYYSGGSHGRLFPETLPAYGGVLWKVGLDPRGQGEGWEDVRSFGDIRAVIDRLDSDDEFWEDLVRKWRRDAGTPDLTEESLDGWAEVPIARQLGAGDPERSASLLFQAAERQLARGGKRGSQDVVRTLEQARDVLLDAHLESRWQERLKKFLLTHKRRKALVASLAQAFGAKNPSSGGRGSR